MNRGKIEPRTKRRKRGRRASRLQSGFSSDREVELRGNMVYLRGHALEELKEFAPEYRMTLRAAFLAILRCGLPLVLAEHRIGKLVQKLKAASHKGATRRVPALQAIWRQIKVKSAHAFKRRLLIAVRPALRGWTRPG